MRRYGELGVSFALALKRRLAVLQALVSVAPLRGEVLDRNALDILVPAWTDLCNRCIEDNVYYSPRYAQALLATVGGETDVRFAVVWDKAKLLAFMPFAVRNGAIPGLQAGACAWQTKYTFSCTPLLDRDHSIAAAETLVSVLETVHSGEWIVPTIGADGGALSSISAAFTQRGVPYALVNLFQRAVVDLEGAFDEYVIRHLSDKRRKDLARNRRRLERIGNVAHEIHMSGEGLSQAVEAFLRIEASGWKGRRGTALACAPDTEQFAKRAFTGCDRTSIARADVLTLDHKPIAVSLIVLAGDTGFTVKCCYDETYRSHSAGLLLEMEVLRSFLNGHWAKRLDSATAGNHVIDGFWAGRVAVGDLMFSLAHHNAGVRLSALRTVQMLRLNSKAVIKKGLARLRDS